MVHRASGTNIPGSGATTVLEPGAPHGELTAHPEQVHEGFVQVRAAGDWDHVITIIELLSPANKAAGSAGREEYLQKQGEILRSETHLLEVDLLRRGLHTVAAPLEGLRRRGHYDAVISLHRHSGFKYQFWINRIQIAPVGPGTVGRGQSRRCARLAVGLRSNLQCRTVYSAR